MPDSRNVLRRHPFVSLAFLFLAVAWWFDKTRPAPKKLDFARPIVTGEGAIICPQSLLFDVRADHGPEAVFSVFTAIANRAEKVHAIGCEEVRGGIPVEAHRMSPPNDDYVAVTFDAGQFSTFFTMSGDLENPEGAHAFVPPVAAPLPKSPAAQPQPPEQPIESQEAKPFSIPDVNAAPLMEQQPPAPIERRPPPQN